MLMKSSVSVTGSSLGDALDTDGENPKNSTITHQAATRMCHRMNVDTSGSDITTKLGSQEQ